MVSSSFKFRQNNSTIFASQMGNRRSLKDKEDKLNEYQPKLIYHVNKLAALGIRSEDLDKKQKLTACCTFTR